MPSGWRVKDPAGFIEKLVQGLHDSGEEIFDVSQRYVPVDEGTLKASGVLIKLPNGIRILYRTTYAARQEWGLPAGHTEQVRKHSVREYRIRAHTRTSRGGKVVSVPARVQPTHERGPFTRVFLQGYKGRFYLTRSWDETRPKVIEFIARLHRRHT